MPYTWTSRGTTTDAAFGTDLLAAGGAFAPVPRYELNRSMQANGTAKASPKACGNIELLLSGLKTTQFAPRTSMEIDLIDTLGCRIAVNCNCKRGSRSFVEL